MSATSFSFQSALSPPLPIHRFSVEHYHRLGELGVLGSGDRVELLEGWIVKKNEATSCTRIGSNSFRQMASFAGFGAMYRAPSATNYA